MSVRVERSRFEAAVLAGKFDHIYKLPLTGPAILERYGEGYAHEVLDLLWRMWRLARGEPRTPIGWLYRSKGSARWIFTDAATFFRETLCNDKSFEYRPVYD